MQDLARLFSLGKQQKKVLHVSADSQRVWDCLYEFSDYNPYPPPHMLYSLQ